MNGPNPTTAPNQDWGWGYQILNYLELSSLWNNTTGGMLNGTWAAADNLIRAFPVPVYFCPSKGSRPHTMTSTTIGATVGLLDYAGNAGCNRQVDIKDLPPGVGNPPSRNLSLSIRIRATGWMAS